VADELDIRTVTVDFSGAEPYFRLDMFFQLATAEATIHVVLAEGVDCRLGPLLTISGAADATGLTEVFAHERIDYGDILLLSTEVPFGDEPGRPPARLLMRMPEGCLHIAGDQQFLDWSDRVLSHMAESEIVSLAEVMAAMRRAEDTLVPPAPAASLPPALRHELEQALKRSDLAALMSVFHQAKRLADEAQRRHPPTEDGDMPPETVHLSEVGRSLVDLIERAANPTTARAIVASLVNQGVDPETVSFYGVSRRGRGLRTVDVLRRLLEVVVTSAATTPLGDAAADLLARSVETRQQRRAILCRLEEALAKTGKP